MSMKKFAASTIVAQRGIVLDKTGRGDYHKTGEMYKFVQTFIRQIQKEENAMKIDLSCPVDIGSAQVREVGIGTLRLRNLSPKTIASIEMAFQTPSGHGAQRVMDVRAPEGSLFEISIPAMGVQVGEEGDAVIDRIWFDDASVWRRDPAQTYSYVPGLLSEGRALDELRFVAGQDAVCYPSEQTPVWVCVCGGANSVERGLCRVCGRDRAGTFEYYNAQAVQTAVRAHEEEMNEKAQKAVRESADMARVRELLQKRKRRTRRIILASVIAAVVVATLAIAYVTAGRDLFAYLGAKAKLTTGNYTQAHEEFLALGDYRDAPELAQEAQYEMALAKSEATDAQTAREGIAQLEQLGTAQATEAAAKARLAWAAVFEEQGDYASAEALLADISSVPEAMEPLERVGYQLALQEQAAGDYARAADRFQELGDYADAAALFVPCQYQAATKAMSEEDYDDAIARFQTIMDYEDVPTLLPEAVYQRGKIMVVQGEYERAALEFAELDGYRDSRDQTMDAYYRAGIQAMDAADYQQAVGYFKSAGDYMDARTLYAQCAIFVALVYEDNGQYADAIALLSDIKDTGEGARAQWQTSVYQYGQMLYSEGDYFEAYEQFRQISDYEDAAQRADLSRLEQAAQLETEGEYDDAIAIYESLGADYGAPELAKQARYRKAEALETQGDYAKAQEIYLALGAYKDAAARASESGYANAQVLWDKKEYAQAYAQFAALGDYLDAKEKAQTVADAWLQSAKAAADAAMEKGDYDTVIKQLEALVQETLPPAYADLAQMYSEANYLAAKALIDADDRLGALVYLRRIPTYKDTEKQLQNNAYVLLGDWVTGEGIRAQFREDGTFIIDEDSGVYRLSNYALYTGETKEGMAANYSLTSLGEDRLTITRTRDGKILRFEREKSAT